MDSIPALEVISAQREDNGVEKEGQWTVPGVAGGVVTAFVLRKHCVLSMSCGWLRVEVGLATQIVIRWKKAQSKQSLQNEGAVQGQS